MPSVIKYRDRLEYELRKGEMGIVYQGYDLALERTVAIKLLSKSDLGTRVKPEN